MENTAGIERISFLDDLLQRFIDAAFAAGENNEREENSRRRTRDAISNSTFRHPPYS